MLNKNIHAVGSLGSRKGKSKIDMVQGIRSKSYRILNEELQLQLIIIQKTLIFMANFSITSICSQRKKKLYSF